MRPRLTATIRLITGVVVLAVVGAGALVAAAGADAGPCQPPRCVTGSITVNGENLPFNVLLPVGYAATTRRYPVVYLLHGGLSDQNDWLGGHADTFTAGLPENEKAVVVLPSSVGIGDWIDWQNGKHLYETALVKVLVPYIDAHYRTIPERSYRAIAGLSAGGFGALHDAARHPDLFAAVGAFSGIDEADDPVQQAGDEALPAVSALCALAQSNPETACASNASLADVLPPSGWGDPVTNELFYHNHNPGDLAINYRGMAVWIASGNGMPCDPAQADASSMALEAGLVRHENVEFDAHLVSAAIPHTTIYWPCGQHDWPNFQHDLEVWWPTMIEALGRPDPPAFDYRTADPAFSVWGWNFTADAARAPEFLTVSGASADGLGLTGSGLTTVTTADIFAPHERVSLTGATTPTATADDSGRLTFQVDLGPAHAFQEYTAQATATATATNLAASGYFVSKLVRFSAR